MAYLLIRLEGEEVGRCELPGPVTIGRAPECDLCLLERRLSRVHCVLEKDGETWIVRDLDSRNGTRVNGQAIRRRRLYHGDMISLADTVKLVFGVGPLPDPRPLDPLESLMSGSGPGEWEGVAVGEGPTAPVVYGARGRLFPAPRPRPPGGVHVGSRP